MGRSCCKTGTVYYFAVVCTIGLGAGDSSSAGTATAAIGRPAVWPSSSTATSPDAAASRRRRSRFDFNALAVLHDIRPSCRYTRLTAADDDDGVVRASVTVDGQRYEGAGASWRAAKRSAASRALHHVLELRTLTSDF